MRKAAPFFQFMLLVIGLSSVFILLRFPLLEGRAQNLHWTAIYSDPFILIVYALSLIYFYGLWKLSEILQAVKRQKIFTTSSIQILKHIQQAAIMMSIGICLLALYIALWHHTDDDPAGFIALCILLLIICSIVFGAASIFQKMLTRHLNPSH